MSSCPKLWLLVAGALWSANASAAPTALGFADGRSGQSLDGAWHAIVDPYDNGLVDYRNQPRPGGYFQDAPPKNRSDLVEYDFARSPTLNVPGDWNTQRRRAALLRGDGLVSSGGSTRPPSPNGARQFVQFGAATQRAIVWLNGRRLGRARRGLHAVRLRGDRPAAATRQLAGRAGQQHAASGRRARDQHRLVELRRADPRACALLETPARFIRACARPVRRSDPRTGSPGTCSSTAHAAPTAGDDCDPRAERLRRPSRPTPRPGDVRLSGRRRLPWSPEAPKLYDVTIPTGGDASTIGSAFARSRRWGRHPAQRRAGLPARYLPARGESAAPAAGPLPRSRRQPARAGPRSSAAISSASPIIRTTTTWPASPTRSA